MVYNIAFKSSVVPEDGRSAVIIPLYKGKEEWTIIECSNYRGISLMWLEKYMSGY